MNLNRLPPLPEPTSAEPGTAEKLAVMIWRYANNRRIFHPDDNLGYTTARDQPRVKLIVGDGRSSRCHRKSRAEFLRGYIGA